MPRIHVIINSKAGTAGAEQRRNIRAAFAAAGVKPKLRVFSGNPADEARQAVKDPECEILVAAGGDGTVGAVAGVAIAQGKTFGVIPAGTLNHFARDTGLPTEISAAVDAICAGKAQHIDYLRVADRICLNNLSLGVYPRLVKRRERTQKRIGKWPAVIVEGFKLITRPPKRQTITITLDGRTRRLKTPFIFIGNNDYHTEAGGLGGRDNLTSGRLCIFISRHRRWWQLGLNVMRAFLGLKPTDGMVVRYGTEVTINHSRGSMTIAIDGETVKVPSPFTVRMQKGGLKLLKT